MGKGDRKTLKGKRYNASYGNSRSHAARKAIVLAGATAPATTKKTVVKRSVSKAG